MNESNASYHDEIHEECGLFGIYSRDGRAVAQDAYLALYALQHRGQESCGIAVCDDGIIRAHREVGLVKDVFDMEHLEALGGGQIAVGHVRYAPREGRSSANAQPLVMRYLKGTLALGHNGNLNNWRRLRAELEQEGAIFQTTCDAELICYVIARERLKCASVEQAISAGMHRLGGAYSLVMMSPRKLIAVRDPQGFRPLCIGTLGESIVIASESCALESMGAQFLRDVEPGEIVVVDDEGLHAHRTHCGGGGSLCVFEQVYFARPDSQMDGVSVQQARHRAGASLAELHPVEADLVIGVPDSGLDAAMGYASASGIPYGIGFVKNRYVSSAVSGGTLRERESLVRLKLNPIAAAVAGKRVVLIDDSIVRGTTCAHIVRLLREAGAKEVHFRASSPPFLHPCYFGTDISERDDLIACHMNAQQLCQHIGADSLGYLSVEKLHAMVAGLNIGLCDGCFTGHYPIAVDAD